MNKINYLYIALLILVIGFLSSYWMNRPIYTAIPHNNDLKNCMSCHQGSLSQDAWKGVPEWHNEKFRNPALSLENREEHRQKAHDNRKQCMLCHAPNFQAKCANCHTQNEWE
jgi:hypothetical protein